MQLVINSYGSRLHKVGECFEVKMDDSKDIVSAQKVDSILLTTGGSLTTDAIQLAMNNNIDIVFLDRYGNPFGRIWQSKLGSTTRIRRRQLEIAEKEEGLKIVQGWIVQKMDNQILFLEQLMRHRASKEEFIQDSIDMMMALKEKLKYLKGTIEEKRSEILGLEGSASRIYFKTIADLIPPKYKFKGRSRHPARDEFNAMLNYCYGILYSMVEKACLIAGLDPYIGFLHTDNYNKKSLVFDLIELYRIIGDKTTFYLFSKRKIKEDFFEKSRKGVFLVKDGKKVLIDAFNERMDKKIRYRGRNLHQHDIMQFDCHKFANSLIKQDKREKS